MLHVLFEKAIEWGYAWPNPVAKVKPFKKPQRDRFLQPEELPRFFEALHESEDKARSLDATFRDGALLLLFTGARKSNLLSMCWDDISLDRAEWAIPGNQTKSGLAMTVPLCSYAIEILQKRQGVTNTPWVFPNTKGTGPIYEPRRAWRHFRVLARIPDVTIHDLRLRPTE